MTLPSGIHLTNISGEWEFQKSLFFLVNNFSYFPLQINDNSLKKEFIQICIILYASQYHFYKHYLTWSLKETLMEVG